MYSSHDVAKTITFLLDRYFNQQTTHFHIQKIIVICQSLFLLRKGYPITNDPICAYKYGPIIPELYQFLKTYKGDKIPPLNRESCLSNDDTCFLYEILKNIIEIPPVTLAELLIKPQSPWEMALSRYNHGGSSVINNHELERYYYSITSAAS